MPVYGQKVRGLTPPGSPREVNVEEELQGWIAEYVTAVSLESHASPDEDAGRFLEWLSEFDPEALERLGLDSITEETDTVEFMTLRQRVAQARFQSLSDGSDARLTNAALLERLLVYLNPSHVWATWQSRTLDDLETNAGSAVLFFPVGHDVRTAVVSPEVEPSLRTLSRRGPQRLRALAAQLPGWKRDDVCALVRDLCARGVLAVA